MVFLWPFTLKFSTMKLLGIIEGWSKLQRAIFFKIPQVSYLSATLEALNFQIKVSGWNTIYLNICSWTGDSLISKIVIKWM